MNSPSVSENYYSNDSTFDSILPARHQQLSRIHWTPLQVAKKAAAFLAPASGNRVLDIGSGVGKFCLAAAHYFPDAEFYGIEQRRDLVEIANGAKDISGLSNAHFQHGNFTQLDLAAYGSIYFFNSFCENLIDRDYAGNLTYSDDMPDLAHIDKRLEYSTSLYNYYSNYLHRQLDTMPSGTRLATYHGLGLEVPYSYKMVGAHFGKTLKLWIRK